ncbi:metal-sensitive transcriptional regulator [Paenibacillus sp. JX-17]|uniref:Metal-sensitive transcriptional regulator n=1 Tax=Paenibacillus lacisoli TaxID=3064525 RepID=A0ABT9CH35_9BACL|nr:metal-sensitive transcriptional regulator [Paenibacillus sp. JX-17]MDO7907959.1 metal-sensitive transcriptional regulator [Paenibacillus sp. JX-17]
MDYQYPDNIKSRLKRIEGQARGVLRLMEEQQPCKDVVAQLSAIRNAADKAIAQIVAENLLHCIQTEQAAGDPDTERLVEEAVKLLVKSR